MTINNQGFTLIELVLTLAVVSIVLLTGIPSLNKMTESNRFVTQINSISGSLALARSEAIKSGTTVTICASSNGTSCNVTTWHSGWIVFTDVDKDTVVDAGVDNLIQIQGALNGGGTLTLTLNGNAGVFQFLADGSSRGGKMGTFTLCPANGSTSEKEAKAKAVNINLIGRNSRAQGATPTETPVHDAAGNDISC